MRQMGSLAAVVFLAFASETVEGGLILQSEQFRADLQLTRFGESPDTHSVAIGGPGHFTDTLQFGSPGSARGTIGYSYQVSDQALDLQGNVSFGVPRDFSRPSSAILDAGFNVAFSVTDTALPIHVSWQGFDHFVHGADVIESFPWLLHGTWLHDDVWLMPPGNYDYASGVHGEINGLDDGGSTFATGARLSLTPALAPNIAHVPEPSALVLLAGLGTIAGLAALRRWQAGGKQVLSARPTDGQNRSHFC